MLLVAIVALAARLVFALVSFTLTRGVLIPDEKQYIDLAHTVASGHSADSWSPGYGQSLYDSTWAFTAPIRLLFDLFTTTRLLGQLWSVAFGVVTALLVVRLGREVLPRQWVLVAGLVAALVPSQVLWSSVVLRESMVWAGLMMAAVGFVASVRASGRAAIGWMAFASLGLLLIGLLRDQTMLAAVFAMAPAMVVAATDRRGRRMLGTLLLAITIPWLSGTGPAGAKLIADQVPELGTLRANLASGADSAFTGTTVTIPETTTGHGTDGQDAITPPELGPGEKVVVAPNGQVYVVRESASSNLRAIPTGAMAVLFRPFLWEPAGSLPLRFAAVENLGWYLLYGLALYAFVTITREQRRLLAYPMFASGAILLVAFVTQGNLGTAFRHRGQVLPLLIVPALLGATKLAALWSTRPTANGGQG